MFQFDQPFVISDDLDVLKKMGMSFNLDSGSCTPEDVVKAKELLPKPFERFLNGEPVTPYIAHTWLTQWRLL